MDSFFFYNWQNLCFLRLENPWKLKLAVLGLHYRIRDESPSNHKEQLCQKSYVNKVFPLFANSKLIGVSFIVILQLEMTNTV